MGTEICLCVCVCVCVCVHVCACRKEGGLVQVKTSQEDGFHLPMLCLH